MKTHNKTVKVTVVDATPTTPARVVEAPVSYPEYETREEAQALFAATVSDEDFKAALGALNYGVNLNARSAVTAEIKRQWKPATFTKDGKEVAWRTLPADARIKVAKYYWAGIQLEIAQTGGKGNEDQWKMVNEVLADGLLIRKGDDLVEPPKKKGA